MKSLLLAALCLLMSATAVAQQPPIATANSRFELDQPAATASEAASYLYKFYLDGSQSSATLVPVSCSGAGSPFVCTAGVPPLSPGNHRIEITASNSAGESDKSVPFDFSFVETPGKPANIRIR